MKKKQTNIKVGQKPPILLERMNEMKLPALFEAIDNGEFENDREMIYVITVSLIRISNSLIRQYNLDDKALYRMYRTYLKTGEYVIPTNEI